MRLAQSKKKNGLPEGKPLHWLVAGAAHERIFAGFDSRTEWIGLQPGAQLAGLLRAIPCITLRHVIKSFRHKGLERLFRKGDARGIQPQHAGRITRILDLLDEASNPEQLTVPGLFLHPLKGVRKGEWAMTVSGNWRITFRFKGEDVIVVNLEDYH